MTVHAQHNGHDIYLDTEANVWRFRDIGNVVNHERACSRCGLAPVQIRLHHPTPTHKRTTAGVDACLGPLLQALNDGGMQTIASCCGHGGPWGAVILEDHRELLVFPTLAARCEFMDRTPPDMAVPFAFPASVQRGEGRG